MRRVLYNGKIITPFEIIRNGGVIVEDNRIIKTFRGLDFEREGQLIDCQGNYISPGFIDIHLHGGGNADVMDGTVEAVETVALTHAKYGTTSMLPTTLSQTKENVIKALGAVNEAKLKGVKGAKILGARLEGNYISMKHKGAQNPEFIKSPVREEYEEIVSSTGDVKMISAAPEIPGGLEFARNMSSRGIVMSIAHSDATYQETLEAMNSGYSHVTHIFNGNSLLHSPYYYCQIGVCETALLIDEYSVEVIADGKHLPPELLKLIYKIKGPDKVNLVTDAMRAAGMPEGKYDLGGLEAIVEDDVAMLADRSSFAGSVCTSDRAIRTMYKSAGVSLVDAVKMMTLTPARIIHIEKQKGILFPGMDADLNVFDDDINMLYTLIEGEEFNNTLY